MTAPTYEDIDEVLSLASQYTNTDGKDDPIQPRPKNKELETEFGVAQNMPFSVAFTGGEEKDLVEVLHGYEEGPTVRQLVNMRRTDGQARALYRLIALPLRSALQGVTFVPEDNDGQKEADFIKDMFTLPPSSGGMTVTLQRTVAQMLMAVFDGFSAFEQVYWVPKRGPLKGKITLKKLAYRPSETVTFLADKTGGFAGLRQRTSFQGHTVDVAIKGKNSVYYAANEEERPFYGISYFQSAFYHYDKKVKLYFIAHLAAQRAAVGTRKGTMPKNASTNDKNKFMRALADMGVAQHIALPGPEWNVEILKEGGGFDFLSYINHHNSQMSKSVLAGFFDENQGSGSGDASLVDFGKQDDTLFMLMLKTIMDDIASIFNHYIIPKFVDWNFGSSKYPKFHWGSFTDEQKNAINLTFASLAVAGQSLTVTPEFMFEIEKYMADEFGLEIDYKKIEEERAKAKEAAQAQSEADQQALQDAQNMALQGDQGQTDEYGNPIDQGQQEGPPLPPGVNLTYTVSDDDLVLMARQLLSEVADDDTIG